MKNTELIIVAASCSNGTCPTIYQADDSTGTLIVQGYTFNLDCPDGEQAVEIPVSLVEQYLATEREREQAQSSD